MDGGTYKSGWMDGWMDVEQGNRVCLFGVCWRRKKGREKEGGEDEDDEDRTTTRTRKRDLE